MPLEIQDGRVIGVSATAGCTAGAIWVGDGIAGVFLDTYTAASTNTNVPVALEGVFTVTKKAHGDAWAVGEKIYAHTTGTTITAVAAATGGALPLGIAVKPLPSATGSTSGTVKLCTF